MLRHVIDEFSRNHTYVLYDTRGCGLSQRRVDDISLDAWVRDLETVVDALGLDRFSLQGLSCGAPIAVAYAARHPERVSRMVLLNGFATSYLSTSKRDPRIVEEAETLLKIIEVGWSSGSPAFRQVFAAKCFPDATAEQWRAFDELGRLSVTPEMAVRYLRALMSINVKEDAVRVRCPTLAFHTKGDQIMYFEQGRRLAALIPGARFVPLEGRNHIPFENEPAWATFVKEVRAFHGTPVGPQQDGHEVHDLLTTRQLEVLQRAPRGRPTSRLRASCRSARARSKCTWQAP